MRKRKVLGVLFYIFNAAIMFGIAMTSRGIPHNRPETIFMLLSGLNGYNTRMGAGALYGQGITVARDTFHQGDLYEILDTPVYVVPYA